MRATHLTGSLTKPDVVVDDVPEPGRPKGDQLLVRVVACSVNGTDLGMASGGLPSVIFRRSVLGFDIAGEVLACGPAVTGFEVGDRVVALLGHTGGGLAERVVLPQSRAAIAPDTTSAQQAAALPLSGLTALQMVRGGGGVYARRSSRVLVVGAAGGIGSYCVLLAKLYGAHVTAVASGDRVEYVRGLGADEVVNGHAQEVMGGGEHWDVVLDTPGVLDFGQVRPILTDDGVLVSTKAISADVVRGALRDRLRGDGPRFVSVRTKVGADLAYLVRLVDEGRLRIPLDRTFALEDTVAAFAHARSGKVQGKVVVTP